MTQLETILDPLRACTNCFVSKCANVVKGAGQIRSHPSMLRVSEHPWISLPLCLALSACSRGAFGVFTSQDQISHVKSCFIAAGCYLYMC